MLNEETRMLPTNIKKIHITWNKIILLKLQFQKHWFVTYKAHYFGHTCTIPWFNAFALCVFNPQFTSESFLTRYESYYVDNQMVLIDQ